MATHNNVSLLGIVRRNPILQSNGVETVASVAISTIVGLRDESFRKVTGQNCCKFCNTHRRRKNGK